MQNSGLMIRFLSRMCKRFMLIRDMTISSTDPCRAPHVSRRNGSKLSVRPHTGLKPRC
jgi:hypothetical protein